MKGKQSVILDRFIEALAPVECLGCGAEGAALCRDCFAAFRYGAQVCFGCGVRSNGGQACEVCSAAFVLKGVTVAARYGGGMKELVLAVKFRRLRSGVRVAADMMAEVAPGRPFDVVTGVPITPARYRERGYNQSELLARQVARRLGLSYCPALGRGTSQHQLGLNRAERLDRIKGAFYAVRRMEGLRVLVVDDVVTTGATLNECAQTLIGAGAAEVWGLALARR